MVSPFGSVTSAGCGSLEGSCFVSAPAPCGCCADKPAGNMKSTKFKVNIFFSMVFSLPHSSSAGGGTGRAGQGDYNRAVRRHQIFLGGLLYLFGGYGSQLLISRINEVGIVIKDRRRPNLIGKKKR